MIFLMAKEVARRVHYHPGHLYAACKEGQFPKPIKLSSRRNVWILSEIIEYQEGLARSRYGRDLPKPGNTRDFPGVVSLTPQLASGETLKAEPKRRQAPTSSFGY